MRDRSKEAHIPVGFTLHHKLQGHSKEINRIAWSPDGHILASPSNDHTIRLWDTQTGQLLHILKGDSECQSVTWSNNTRILASGTVDGSILFWDTQTGHCLRTLKVQSGCRSVTWSPDGQVLASCSLNQSIYLWDMKTGNYMRSLTRDSGWINCIAWSPDGRILASGSVSDARSSSRGGKICLWDTKTWQLLQTFTIAYSIYSIAWSSDGKGFFTGSSDQAIRVWDLQSGRQVRTLEGHTGVVTCISCSYDGYLLASKSYDGTVCIWRTTNWEMIATLERPVSNSWVSGLAFHPKSHMLATLDEEDLTIRVWDLDITDLLKTTPVISSVHYANAKVVLVGDSGVGKSGLSLVLTKQPFVPTVSTHGRHIWTFDNQKVERGDGRIENRETLLWDLAGQPGYRLVHQLHLNEVAVTLVVFDAHNETDPFAGVNYWARALHTAQQIQGDSLQPVRKLLVAARIDRGGKSVSRKRIEEIIQNLDFDEYIETSAKEGWGIETLASAIKAAIDWDKLPKVTSTNLFQRIKAFLIAEKEAGRSMSTVDDLYRTFLKAENLQGETDGLLPLFETCIGRVESADLIKRLSFGNLVLLQPELLDAYASALVISVRDDPDGLGSITETKARMGDFRMPIDERLKDKEQEKLLLIAMIEDLLRRELVLREESFLVFPSQSTREYPSLPDPEGKSVIFSFEGPIQNIFTTLVVRISNSGLFKKQEIWKNAVTYVASVDGICGIILRNIGEGSGELALFFDEYTSEQTRTHFEDYVQAHLHRRALPESVQRRRIFVCPGCATSVTDTQVERRRQLGFSWMRCNVCNKEISLLDREKTLTIVSTSLVPEMDRIADAQRVRETATSIIQGKIATGDFDVFLCHNSKDKSEVKEIGESLKEFGILPWLDEWNLRPGFPWQRLLEEQIGKIRSAAVFVGKDGIGPWQQEELEAFLREFVKRGNPVIPVLLSSAPKEPVLPIFLKSRTWVDFRRRIPNPLERLVWGITGKRDSLEFLPLLSK